jgi:predicted acyl esterase
VEVTGPMELTVWASSSTVETDFTGRLVDLWFNGNVYNLVDSIVRARYRESAASDT